MTTVLALKVFGVCAVYAFGACALYDLGHNWLIWRKCRRVGHFLGDMLLLSVLGAGFVMLMIAQGGVMRWYNAAAVILGVWVYNVSIKRFMRRGFYWVFAAGAWLWQKMTFPGRKLAALIKKCYKKRQKKFKKLRQSTGNFPADDV